MQNVRNAGEKNKTICVNRNTEGEGPGRLPTSSTIEQKKHFSKLQMSIHDVKPPKQQLQTACASEQPLSSPSSLLFSISSSQYITLHGHHQPLHAGFCSICGRPSTTPKRPSESCAPELNFKGEDDHAVKEKGAEKEHGMYDAEDKHCQVKANKFREEKHEVYSISLPYTYIKQPIPLSIYHSNKIDSFARIVKCKSESFRVDIRTNDVIGKCIKFPRSVETRSNNEVNREDETKGSCMQEQQCNAHKTRLRLFFFCASCSFRGRHSRHQNDCTKHAFTFFFCASCSFRGRHFSSPKRLH
jgi:hypothetical protein